MRLPARVRHTCYVHPTLFNHVLQVKHDDDASGQTPLTCLSLFPYTSLCYHILVALNYHTSVTSLAFIPMAPKPASTAGKAPASTASKALAKPTEGSKAAKKTSSFKAAGEGGEEKKKRRKLHKETYSSYIYKGKLSSLH